MSWTMIHGFLTGGGACIVAALVSDKSDSFPRNLALVLGLVVLVVMTMPAGVSLLP